MDTGACRSLGGLVLLLAGTTLLLPAGCSQCPQPRHHRSERDWSRSGPVPAPVELLAAAGSSYPAGLLFDRVPGRLPASAFAFRSDWPSTNAFYSTGQQVFYSEHFSDYQGPLFPNLPWDYTYLQLDSVRVGAGFR